MTDPARPGVPEPLFERALARLTQTLDLTLRDAFADVADDLVDAVGVEPDPAEQRALRTAADLLREESAERGRQIGQALAERAERCLDYASRADDENRALSLLLEDETSQQMLVNDLARSVRQIVGADYLAYVDRIRAWWPGLWQDDDLNPLGARTIASAAVRGFHLPDATNGARQQVRRALLRRLPAVLALAIEDLLRWFGAQDVSGAEQPAARGRGAGGRRPRQADPDAESAGSVDAAADTEPNATTRATPVAGDADASASAALPGQRALESSERAADAARTLGVSALSRGGPAPLPVLPTLQPVVELERDAVAFAHAIGVTPYGREARTRFFGNARSRLRDAQVPAAQLAVVDLVSAMFDYVIDDTRLPDSVKPLVWRLQQPTLALALLDPAYLGDEPRSLRRLIENLGAIANAFAEDIGRGGELHRRLETVVRAVEIVAGALQTRSTVMARQVDHEYSRAARNVTQLIERLVRDRSELESTKHQRNRRDYRRRPSREREQEVTVRLSVMLGERLERHQVPESVREFLLTVWLRQLRTAALRDGEDSGEFKVAMQVVDDLLWSLDTGTESGARRELAVRIPPLIRLLTQGVREVGIKDEELKPFFDELFLIHLRKMQGGDDDTPPTRQRSRRGPRTRPGNTGPATRSGNTRPARAASATPAPSRPADDPADDPAAAPRASGSPPPEATRTDATRAEPTRADAELARGAEEEAAAGAPGQRLLEVLSSIDLADLPAAPSVIPMMGADPVERLVRGHWLQLMTRDGVASFAKVAWINERRTVILLVRHPDRRALSLRAAELRERFSQGRAFLIE